MEQIENTLASAKTFLEDDLKQEKEYEVNFN